MNDERVTRKCIVCDEDKEKGIAIYGTFLCDQCERAIIKTDVKEPEYLLYVERLRHIWLKDA